MQSGRYGKCYGVLYKEDGNVLAGNKIEQIEDHLKRGMWRYQLDDARFTPQVVALENGVEMDLGKT